jgi:iron(III) transport system ATP-binding protein
VTVLVLEALSKSFQRAGVVVDSVNLRIEDGEFFTLLGPSGCGKSTILRMIAGLEEPTSGRILFGNRDVTFDPPNQRGIGLVFQNYALFPHLSVTRNVAFGLEVRKMSSVEIEKRVMAALNQVQLGSLGQARVDQLSGGQQQRVALARALVIRPHFLLLDEPLSNLDAMLRGETRAMLRAVHNESEVTTIYVTHDQEEALGMSDRIAVLNGGRIHQVAAPREIYEKPATRFVASFIGRNNAIEATVIRLRNDSVTIQFATGAEVTISSSQSAPDLKIAEGAKVVACIRAESLCISDEGPLDGILSDIEYSGSGFTCIVKSSVGDLKIEVPNSVRLPARGETVHLKIATTAVYLIQP